MASTSTSVAVAINTSTSATIKRREIVTGMPDSARPICSIVRPATLEAGTARLVWYGSNDALTWYPLNDNTGKARVTVLPSAAAVAANDLPSDLFLRWDYYRFVVADSASVAVTQTAARTFTLMAASL